MQGDNHPAKRALLEARERTIATLAENFARDAIGLETFEQRLSDAYACGTVEELSALVRDLDSAPTPDVVAMATSMAAYTPAAIVKPVRGVPSVTPRTLSAFLGSVERRGAVEMADGTRARAVLGSLEIDLRDVAFPAGVTEVHVRAVLGSIEIIVPSDLHVEVEGSGIAGSFESHTRPHRSAPPDAATLRIVGSAVLGSLEIHARTPAPVAQFVKQLRAGQ